MTRRVNPQTRGNGITPPLLPGYGLAVSVLGYERDTRVIKQWNGGTKERARSQSEAKMASAERSNQNPALGSESEQPALSSGYSAGDLELSGADAG
jgi:hypothetical protein